MVRVVVSGAAGRMGRRLLELVQQDPDTILVGALESPAHAAQGQTVGSLCAESSSAKGGDVRVAAGWPKDLSADVIIDFSAPEQTVTLAQLAAEKGCAMVVG